MAIAVICADQLREPRSHLPSDIIDRSAIFKSSWNFIVPTSDLTDIIVLNKDIFGKNINVLAAGVSKSSNSRASAMNCGREGMDWMSARIQSCHEQTPSPKDAFYLPRKA